MLAAVAQVGSVSQSSLRRFSGVSLCAGTGSATTAATRTPGRSAASQGSGTPPGPTSSKKKRPAICHESWPIVPRRTVTRFVGGDSWQIRGSVFFSLSYRADGSIDPVVISAVGIGEYDAALGPIEAENFVELTGPGGKVIVGPLPSVAVHNCDINYGAPTANRQPPLRVCCQRLPLCVPTAFLLCVPAAVPCAIAAVSCVCFRGLPLPKFGAPLSAARPARGRRRLRVRRRRPAADRRPLFEQPC